MKHVPDAEPELVCHESWIVCAKWHEETRMVHPFLVCVFAFDPRQEPSAVVPLAGICAGGRPQGRSLPRLIDLDIQKFFDSVSWDLMLKAVQANTDLPWVVLYVRRWLQAPVQLPDGTLQQRDRGTPQGSPVSPVLANLFLHYAFDVWMAREFPSIRFERYVDDAVVHCVSERQARQVLAALQDRMAEVGLQLHPDKTRIVYCQDGKRRHAFEHTSFTFLGYTFRPRGARAKNGSMFVSFAPAISKDALKKIGQEVRSWRLHRRTPQSFSELARWVNPTYCLMSRCPRGLIRCLI